MNRRLLAIYLNDHLAGATVGVELTRRAAGENAGSALGTFLHDSLLPEIAEDRETLERLMRHLGCTRSRPKVAAGWLIEKLGRLKLNGELRRYSSLSRLLELEGLVAGIEAKRALWVTLAVVTGQEGVGVPVFDFQALTERAESQRSRVEEHRVAAAAEALG
jgi:hypothetical protein